MTSSPLRTRLAALSAIMLCFGLVGMQHLAGFEPDRFAQAEGFEANHLAPTQQSSELKLELIKQEFSFEANGTIHLTYRLIGDLEGSAELSATTTTSIPATTVAPADSTPDNIPTATTTPASPTTVRPPPAPVQLTVEVTNYSPVRTVAAVERIIGGDVRSSTFTGVIDGISLGDLRSRAEFSEDGSAIFTLDIETDSGDSVEGKLKFDEPGLYPLRVEILIGDPNDGNVLTTAGTIVQRLPGSDDPTPSSTTLNIPATDAPPINLAIVTATPPAGPTANAAEKISATTALNDAIELAAAITSPVTLEVPPPLIAALAESPKDQEQLAIDLEHDEFVALPLAPLDVSSAVAVGLSDTYARLLAAGEDLLTDAVPATPSRRDIWLATDPLSASGAQELRDLGVRFVVMPSSLFLETVSQRLPATDQFVEIQLPDGGTLALLVVDDLAAQLTTEATDEILDDFTPTEWAVETIATMLIEQARQSGAPPNLSRTLTTPDLRAPDSRLLIALEQLATTAPGIEFVPGSTLTGVTDTQTVRGEPVMVELPETAGPPLAERFDLIETTRLRMASVASMLPEDDSRPAEWNTELDSLISTGYSDSEVETATENLLSQANQLKTSVQLPEPFTFTLTGRSGTIEIRLHNSHDEPLKVTLQFSSPKINFPRGDRDVTLRPNGETSVIVPVEARSNGTSSINVEVSTPAGESLAEPIALTSRVTALTGLGQVLTVGFILVLLTWWFTHWRSKRRTMLTEDGRERHPTAKQ